MNEPLLLSTDFSGLGSPEEALKRLGVPHRVVFACERDKYARNSYYANHEPEIFYDDVTTRDNKTAPYSDMYVFGFPCQAFSIAGKQKGFEDTRGTLFFNSLDYINQKRPRTFIAENVKGLLSHDNGKTFRTIIDCLAVSENGQQNLYPKLDCVGYHVFYAVHNTKNYGIPQNRERIFIIGFRDEADALNFRQPKGFPLLLKLKDLLQDNPGIKYNLDNEFENAGGRDFSYRENENSISGYRLDKASSGMQEKVYHKPDGILNTITTGHIPKVIYEVPEKYYLSDKALEYIVKDSGNWSDRLSMMNDDTADTAGCITANHHKGVPYNMLTVHINEATKQGYAIAEPGDSINLSVPTSTTRRGRVGKGHANTLDTQCNQAVVVDELITVHKSETKRQGERIYSPEGISQCLSANSTQNGITGLYQTGIRIRRLTPRECFRLQGYSDSFFDKCAAVNSDTQLYKQAGNSITVDTILNIMRQVLIAIKYL